MSSATLSALRASLPAALLLEVAPVADCMLEIHAEEQALVQRAVNSRRQEFSSARRLAHTLLSQLQTHPIPLLSREDRSPAWPEGILGSLSHSRMWCAAAIVPKHKGLLGVGVDIEDLRPFATKLFPEILTARELEQLHKNLPTAQHSFHVLACFSMKEAIYKCLYPLGNVGLGFHDVELDFFSDALQPILTPLEKLRKRLPADTLPKLHFVRHTNFIFSLAVIPHPSSTLE